eukprot:768177-Hanusia_phi.AAC.9
MKPPCGKVGRLMESKNEAFEKHSSLENMPWISLVRASSLFGRLADELIYSFQNDAFVLTQCTFAQMALQACPICKNPCEICEEDLIEADCGACGPVSLHVHCKEKYCRQQGQYLSPFLNSCINLALGIAKGQYKGYPCPRCNKAKVSAQHIRQRDKKKRPEKENKPGKSETKSERNVPVKVSEKSQVKMPVTSTQDLLKAVIADCTADSTTLQSVKNAFKRLLQIHRAFKTEEDQVLNIWKPFASRKVRDEFIALRSHTHPTYMQATSLLKLTSQMNVEGDSEETTKKRYEVADKLMAGTPRDVLEKLDASLDVGRCEALIETLHRKCEAATLYLERLRKSLPAQLAGLDVVQQERVWAWCDIEEHVADGVCCLALANPQNTSDEHQLRSPPFYAGGVPWSVRFYKAKTQGSEAGFMAAYLDAGHALHADPSFEMQVTFTFTLRKTPDQKAVAICRKEATFTFKKDSDNRGWRECVPSAAIDDGLVYLTVEVREGAVATENITISVKLEKCRDVSFKVKPSTAMQKLMDSYCLKQHLRIEKVRFEYLDKKSGRIQVAVMIWEWVDPSSNNIFFQMVEPEQTPSDLGMSADSEELVAIVIDEEIDAVMKRGGVGLLEAAEALDRCGYLPRKALQLVDSIQKAKAKAESIKKEKEIEENVKKVKVKQEPESKKKVASEPTKVTASQNQKGKSANQKPPSVVSSKIETEEASENESDGNDSQEDDFRLINAFGPLRYEFNNKTIHERQVPAFDIPSKQDLEGFEQVKTKRKGNKKSSNREEYGSLEHQYSPRHAPVDNGKAPFGGRKVFIGGTADKDHDELRAHFSQFGAVADVEVLKERDGSYRGFAFVTFHEKKAADSLLSQHHTYIGNVRMEAKPCMQPRGELELDKRIAATLGTSAGQNYSRNLETPVPVVSAWGSGPPNNIKPTFSNVPGREGPRREDSDLVDQWRQADADNSWNAISNLGDMFDPMGASQASTAEASAMDSAAVPTNWDTGATSMDTIVSRDLESMLNLDFEGDEDNVCTICYEDLANACLKPCGHQFCTECITNLKKRAVFQATEGVLCPHCRAPVKEFVLPATGASIPSISQTKSAWGTNTNTVQPPAQSINNYPQSNPGGGVGMPQSHLWGNGQPQDIWGANSGFQGGFAGGDASTLWGGGLPGLNTDQVFSRPSNNSVWGNIGAETWNMQQTQQEGHGSAWNGAFKVPATSSMNSSYGASPSDFPHAGAAKGSGQGQQGEASSVSPPKMDKPNVVQVKVKFTDDREVVVGLSPQDTGKQVRMKIKELTGIPAVAQRLVFQGKMIELNDTLDRKKIKHGVVINCFLREVQEGDEESYLAQSVPQPLPQYAPPMEANIGSQATRNFEDDKQSEDGSQTSSRGGSIKGLSQDDDDWEAVGTKKKKGRAKVEAQKNTFAPVNVPPRNEILAGKQPWNKSRFQFFGLWVGNVHIEVVDQVEFKAAFERFGELCNNRTHGVPPINILPDSSSAFVNFVRYEDADAARTSLQGMLVASTGPLRINASDLMQQYEDQVKLQGPEPNRTSWAPQEVRSSPPQPPPPPPTNPWNLARVAAGNYWEAELSQDAYPVASSSSVSQEERERLARLEQERKDEELARQLFRQEQYEASHAFYIREAQRKRQQAAGSVGETPRRAEAPAHPPALSLPDERLAPKATLMDHLPSHLRGAAEPKPEPLVRNAWGVRKPVISSDGREGLGEEQTWGSDGGWGDTQATTSAWSSNPDEQWETAGPRRKVGMSAWGT